MWRKPCVPLVRDFVANLAEMCWIIISLYIFSDLVFLTLSVYVLLLKEDVFLGSNSVSLKFAVLTSGINQADMVVF